MSSGSVTARLLAELELIRLDNDPSPLADQCVVSAIEEDLAALSASSPSEQGRLDALKRLCHWVGDVRQPLARVLQGRPGR